MRPIKRLLVTNDDGILAGGLLSLLKVLKDRFDIFVVAPASVQSAAAHSITLYDPLISSHIELPSGIEGISVEGRPADCVKLALTELYPEKYGMDQRPDLVISGINAGANVGINVLYSGTVAAAIEAAFFGLPAIAVSLAIKDRVDFDYAAEVAIKTIDFVLDNGILEEGLVLNINIPPVEFGWPRGVRFVRQSTRALPDKFERRVDPRGRVYYWLSGEAEMPISAEEQTDLDCINRGFVSITPLMYDLTNYKVLEEIKSRFSFDSFKV